MSRCACAPCNALHPPCPTCPPDASWHTPIADWWRLEVSELGHGVFVTGAPPAHAAAHSVELWATLEVECVIDLTEYGLCETVSEAVPPMESMERHWLTMEDPCPAPPPGLIAQAVALAGDRPTLVHCHQGVNRAPSVALAILVARGLAPAPALELVATKRPVSGLRYARDVLAEHWGCGFDDPRILELEARRTQLVAANRERVLTGLDPLGGTTR